LNKPPTVEFCEVFRRWQTTSECIAVLGAEVVLIARIYAVYRGNKKLLAIVAGLFLVEIVSILLLLDLDMPGEAPHLYNSLTGCHYSERPTFYFLCWIPALIFESIICFLMLYKAWRAYVAKFSSPLLDFVVCDSVRYFLIVFAILLLNCLVWALAPRLLSEIAVGWAVSLPCALGSRLLLNMRERGCIERASHSTCHADIEAQLSEDAGMLSTVVSLSAVSITELSTVDE